MASKGQRSEFQQRGDCANCGARPPLEGVKYCGSCKQSMLSASSRLYAKWKRTIFEFYGGKCSCCGETEPMFLAVDHINNDGNIQRRRDKTGGYNFYRQLSRRILEGTPPDDLQLLCHNCNWGKHRNKGVCPHVTRYVD